MIQWLYRELLLFLGGYYATFLSFCLLFSTRFPMHFFFSFSFSFLFPKWKSKVAPFNQFSVGVLSHRSCLLCVPISNTFFFFSFSSISLSFSPTLSLCVMDFNVDFPSSNLL